MRGFFVPGDRDDREVRAERDRAALAARLGGRAAPSTRPIPSPARSRATRRTSSRCCRTRRASCTWGTSSTTRSATSSRTCAAGAATACCGRWATTRSACRPRTPRSATACIRASAPSATSPRSARADAPHGLGDGLGPRDLDARARVLPLDAMALPPLLRARASPIARRDWSTGARSTRRCSRTSR